MESTFIAFAGVDWGDQIHQVCLVDRAGDLHQRRFEHSGAGLADLIRWLSEVCAGDPERLGVAIEVPHGPIVDALLDGGFAVFSINPKQLDRFRDRYTVAGAEDDRRDAQVLAASLRTDEKAFRRLSISDPRIIRLRELTRLDEELKTELRRLANRLRAQLQRYYPQVLALNTAGAFVTGFTTGPGARCSTIRARDGCTRHNANAATLMVARCVPLGTECFDY